MKLQKIISKYIAKSSKSIEVNYNSPDYQMGILYAQTLSQNENNFFKDLVSLLKQYIQSKRQVKHKKQYSVNNVAIYSLKINTSEDFLTDSEFIDIISNFKIIALNFCELCQLEAKDLQINILSATPGCFNINFGLVNISGNEFNLAKFDNTKLDLMKNIIKNLTGNNAEEYNGKTLQLLKDCVTGYFTKKITSNNNELKYIDIKQSRRAKKVIYKTVKGKADFHSIILDNNAVLASEIDMLI